MSILRRLFSFYIFSNIHVSIAVFCFTKVTLFAYGVSDNTIPYFNMFSTLISYNFIRFYRIDEINRFVSNWIQSNKKSLLVLNGVGMILLTYLAFRLKFKDFIVLIPFVLATLFYAVPFSKEKLNLRSMTGLKLFLIAFSWAGITVLFPLIHHDISISGNIWIIFIQRFLIIIALAIPFDLRDVNFDKKQIRTLPQSIGVIKSKLLGSIALIVFFVLELFRELNSEKTIITSFIIVAVSLLFLLNASTNQKKYYSSFWVESIPIFWYLILFFQTF